jgi:dipeptidyl aminopeptidase/acylaminoacyl peptidase
MRAISEQPSYSWSPDGTRLAFIGALDGPSADVYLYDLNTRSITRVSTDPAHDYWPSWSPDGSRLLFFGADGFGTGAGYTMNGVWSADRNGSNVTLLYQPTSSGEELLGWRDNESAVLESWDPAQGLSNLRIYNVTTKQTTSLPASPVSGAVAEAGSVISTIDPGAVLFSQAAGLTLLPSGQTQTTSLSGSQVDSVRWIRDSSMFEVQFQDGSLATFQSDGSFSQDAPAALSSAGMGYTNVAMYGLIWAWTANGGNLAGVWINGPGLDFPQIFSGPAVAPLWDPHNNLTFFSRNSLYRVTFDSYYADLALVANVSGDVVDASWVGGIQGFDIYGP